MLLRTCRLENLAKFGRKQGIFVFFTVTDRNDVTAKITVIRNEKSNFRNYCQ